MIHLYIIKEAAIGIQKMFNTQPIQESAAGIENLSFETVTNKFASQESTEIFTNIWKWSRLSNICVLGKRVYHCGWLGHWF